MENNTQYKELDITETGKDYEKPYEEPHMRSGGIHKNYAVFKVARKFKQFYEIDRFMRYVLRKDLPEDAVEEIENAKRNKIIVGDEDVRQKLEDHVSGVKRKSTAVLAREIILTASPGFFKNITDYDKKRWIQENKKWLYQEFGNNLMFAVLHQDRNTTHIHAITSFKLYDEDKECYKLQHSKFFDGIAKLREWQDKYSGAMSKHFDLHRGVQGSKNKNVDLRTIYGMLENPEYDLKPEDAIKKVALQDLKLKQMEKRLEAVQLYNQTLTKENSEIKAINAKASENMLTCQQAISRLISKYGSDEINAILLDVEVSKKHDNSLQM